MLKNEKRNLPEVLPIATEVKLSIKYDVIGCLRVGVLILSTESKLSLVFRIFSKYFGIKSNVSAAIT